MNKQLGAILASSSLAVLPVILHAASGPVIDGGLTGHAAPAKNFVPSNQTEGAARPYGSVQGEQRWSTLGAFTDSFEGGSLADSHWQNPAPFNLAAWTNEAGNAFVEDGKLNIQTVQETHERTFKENCLDGVWFAPKDITDTFHYKSGAIRSHETVTYGYFEASVKGVDVFPGLSPAFWLYSDGPNVGPDGKYLPQSGEFASTFDFSSGTPTPIVGESDYSEIDVVELQQGECTPGTSTCEPTNIADHNLHTRVVKEDGSIRFVRPKDDEHGQRHVQDLGFDPAADFHIYAVENRPDKITWYIDGVKISEKPNTYWHKPMHVTFSMGLRRQLRTQGACNKFRPNDANIQTAGFPAKMQVEYVKSWKVLPSVWVDDTANYQNQSFSNTGDLTVSLGYHAGSEFTVVADGEAGVRVNLIERDENNQFVQAVSTAVDATIPFDDSKKYGGSTIISIPLAGVTPTADLDPGHSYALQPLFRSSNGSTIFPVNGAIGPVVVTGESTGGSTGGNTGGSSGGDTSTGGDTGDSSGSGSDNGSSGDTGNGGDTSGGSTEPVSCDGSFTAVTGVELSASGVTVKKGETLQMNADVFPVCASNKNVTYSSSNTNAAIVNSSGVVTARNAGTTTITVKTKHLGKTDTLQITVTN